MLTCKKCGEPIALDRSHKCQGLKTQGVSLSMPTRPAWAVKVLGEGDRELLAIDTDGSVHGSMEDAAEAAAVFVSELRRLTAAIRAKAKAEALREAADRTPVAWDFPPYASALQIRPWLRARADQYKEEQ